MKTPTPEVSRLRSELQERADHEDADGCLRIFRALEQETPLTAQELLQKSACLQLSDELGSLEDAEKALLEALEIARDYIPALLDLGWFHYVVQDDAETGLSYFRQAEELSRRSLSEALEGRNKCLREIRERQSD